MSNGAPKNTNKGLTHLKLRQRHMGTGNRMYTPSEGRVKLSIFTDVRILELNVVETDFCTEEVPVRLGRGKQTVLKFINLMSKIFYQISTLTDCTPLYPNLRGFSNGFWITYVREVHTTRVGPASIYKRTKKEMWPHESIGCKISKVYNGVSLEKQSI